MGKAADTGGAPSVSMTPSPAPSPGPQPAVLLVEDDPTNQLIALSMLRHLGIEADVASDGRAGVQRAAEKPYDVVLMDIQMPVMDGVEAMRAIRSLLPPARCPRVVAVTAHAVSGTRERLLAAGFDGFYNKPLSIALIQDAVSAPEAGGPPAVEPAFVVHAPRANQDMTEAHASATLIGAVRAHVREMLGEDDEEFVADLVGAFAESSQQAVRDVAEAQAARDAGAVARAAHKLKGSASNIGLDGLTERWDEVETRVRSGDAEVFTEALDRVVAETTRTVTLLETSLG